ncbi:hypothetical protein QC477_005152 [Bacillus cereus]|uniref:hypothetical protein n=1 Tax=Bacillus TaxID=1386 RepID=UPI000B4A8615|nr:MULTISPECIES: hypothetical protein [Bacillus cereus group]EKS8378238.1 hypothetical protein [Bacillus cereus]EKS8384713.1 hypothetical protein [Bacillus cereus]EMA7399737.1 hypothetical protein [Bacillus cereus]MCU5538988.1 hypothetical protein [Bacillus cereus]NNG93889.1 hypothetical protein [Bacillus thuringiensis]
MFEREILNFYRKGMSMWSLLFKLVWIRSTLFVVIQVCTFIAFVIFSFYGLDNTNEMSTWYMSLFIIWEIILLFIFGLCIVRKGKKKFFRIYKIELYNEEWNIFRCILLKEFLIYQEILSVKKEDLEKNRNTLDFCIERLESRLERKKKTRFLTIFSSYSAVFIAFMVPAWTGFNTWFFTQYYNKENHPMALGQATAYLGVIFGSIIIVLALYILLKHLFIDEILRWGDQRISYLIEILQNIKFSLDNPKYFGEFEKKKHIKESIRTLLDEYTVNKEKKEFTWWKTNIRNFKF